MDLINSETETIKEAVSILSRMRSGVPLYEIAAEERISIGDASFRLNDELMQEKKNKDQELHNKIISRYENGGLEEELSKELDIPFTKVKKILAKWGAYQNNTPGYTQRQREQFNEENPDVANNLSLKEREERNNAVADAFASGKSIKEIAGQFYLKPGMVYFILRNKGIQVRKITLRKYKEREIPNRKYDDDFVQNVLTCYKELNNIRKTADKLNEQYRVIYNILKNKNVLQPKICRKESQLTQNPE
ncbi:MAG: hypothetical protein ABI855_07225, partial [Bacteroidota bacterium]